VLSAEQPPADSRRIAFRLCFTHPASEPHRCGCVKLRIAAKKRSPRCHCAGKRRPLPV